jgi:hypothetical protein
MTNLKTKAGHASVRAASGAAMALKGKIKLVVDIDKSRERGQCSSERILEKNR